MGAIGGGAVILFASLALAVGAELTHDIGSTTQSANNTLAKRSHNFNIHEVKDGYELKLNGKGDIRFSDDYRSVVGIGKGGSFSAKESTPDGKREVRIKPTRDGGLDIRYKVDGRNTEFDDNARRWLGDLLEQTLDHKRVKRVKRGSLI